MNNVISDAMRRTIALALTHPLQEKRVKLESPRGSGLWRASSMSGSRSHKDWGIVAVVGATGFGGGAFSRECVATEFSEEGPVLNLVVVPLSPVSLPDAG